MMQAAMNIGAGLYNPSIPPEVITQEQRNGLLQHLKRIISRDK